MESKLEVMNGTSLRAEYKIKGTVLPFIPQWYITHDFILFSFVVDQILTSKRQTMTLK